MDRPYISIMMPAYNAEEYISDAIDSVLAQTYPNWELIIVNDGSIDKTGEIISGYQDPRIRIIYQENAGEATARNTALDNIKSAWIAFLDADDKFMPDHLEKTINFAQQHPEFDGVYTDGFHIDPHGNPLQSLSSRRRGPFEGWIFEQLVRASDVFGPPLCVILQKDIVVKHKLRFDPRIVIGPDWDFFTRYSEHAKFGYLDRHTCLYRVHFTNITVQTGMQKRRQSLAICREKAINLSSFEKCSMDTRSYVFYDLLINLLFDLPEQQAIILEKPAFKSLPKDEQARLLRLMASQILLTNGSDTPFVGLWLEQAYQLAPSDQRGVLLRHLYKLNPEICRLFIKFRRSGKDNPATKPPFEDLKFN